MRYIVLLLIIGISLVSCRDELNLPEYTPIVEDAADPSIAALSPTDGEIITGATTVPVKINFSDDLALSQVQVQIVPVNFSDPGLSMTINTSEKTYTVDTTYTIPSSDSIVYDVLLIASDEASNVVNQAYQFTTK
jgi:hypothetical protein